MNVAEWKQARQWLITSGVIPVTHPVTKPTVDLVDFARSLRDGVFLCNLLLKLKPGCVENFNPRPIAQHTFLKNISSFLIACKVQFRIATEDLFEDSDLYEVTNFGKVVHLLSVLSHTPEARDHKLEPFPKEVHHEYYQDLDQLLRDAEEEPQSNEESIYANLNELAMLRESDVSIYDHAPTAMEEDPYADSGIYEAIVHKIKPIPKPSADVEEKKKFILQELYETEVNYVNALNLIGMNFFAAIKGYCNNDEISLLFAIPQLLKNCHEALLKGFKESCEQGKCDIFVYFEREKSALLQYGEYAAQLPKATEKKAKQFQNARNEISRALQNCQDHSQQRFTLADLLSVPVQRILKYPLLVTELIKCAKKGGVQSEVDALTYLHTFLNDISKYINETKRDFEAVQTIEDIELSLLEYKGPSLKDCGRLRFDGEFRIKLAEEKGDLRKRWAFLFDKVLVICKRGNIIRTFGEVKYQVKYVLNVEGMNITSESHRHTSIRKPSVMQPFKLIAAEFGVAITKDYSANGKSVEHKEAWIGAIRVANNICCPTYARNGGHFFELHTAKGAVSCSLCDRLLWGIYHQGYYCKDCNRYSHGDCLDKQGDCMKTSPRAMTMSPGATSSHPPPHHHHPHMQRSRSSSIPPHPLPQPPLPHQPPAPPPYGTRHKSNGELPKKGKIYIAKMRYDGNPLRARKGHYLSFDKDERLEILDQSDPDWWEAISLITGNKGKVPSSYLKLDEYENYTKKFDKPPPSNGSRLIPATQNSLSGITPRSPQLKRAGMNDNLAGHSWFVGRLSRIDAENMLKDLQDGVFLIRESDQRKGEYAVGLRWKQHPKHIKISVNPDTNRFFVSDAKEFDSVADLVHYYQEHSLGYSFPGVDTTLRCPYWDVNNKPSSDGHRPSVELQHRPNIDMHRPSVELQHRPSVELQHRPSIDLHRPSATQKPSLPPIPPARSGLQNMTVYCEAMYNFNAEYPEELSLEKHGHVKLINKDTARPKWWYGEYKGRTGLFPSNYVRELPPGH